MPSFPAFGSLNIESGLIVTKKSDTEIEVTDSRGRAELVVQIPDVYGLRRENSPATVELVGGLPDTTYYLYATKPDAAWGTDPRASSGFDFVLSVDATLKFQHRYLGVEIATDGSGNIIGPVQDPLHIYVNSVTGDDKNTGWKPDKAKKTIQAGSDAIPYHILNNTTLHITGVFNESPRIEKRVHTGVSFVIDGGTDIVIVADAGGTPWVADISSSSSIGLTGVGWTVDQYAGYWVEILSGPAIGQTRLIQGHTVDTITPVRNFSIDPGALAQFRIVRPATEIGGRMETSHDGEGVMYAQGFYFGASSSAKMYTFGAGGRIRWSHVVSDSPSSQPIGIFGAQNFGAVGYRIDPSTYARLDLATDTYCGLSGRGSGFFGCYHRGGMESLIEGSYFINAWFWKIKIVTVKNGTRHRSVGIEGSPLNAFASPFPAPIRNSFGYAVTTFGPSGSGRSCLYIHHSDISIGSGVDIKGSATNGIELLNSLLIIDAVVSSVPNTNAGVWAHSNSVVLVKPALTPTITGTAVGDLTVDNANPAAGSILDGPHTSDINSVSTIGLSTLTWTVNLYTNKYVEILDGPAAGDIRKVASNTATTITVTVNFSADPGAGAQFRVIEFTSVGSKVFVGTGPTVAWTTITSGIPFSDTTEMVVAKNYTPTF